VDDEVVDCFGCFDYEYVGSFDCFELNQVDCFGYKSYEVDEGAGCLFVDDVEVVEVRVVGYLSFVVVQVVEDDEAVLKFLFRLLVVFLPKFLLKWLTKFL
jgi:hypothetical protein